ncbi:hypothetical protein JAAARDRAFT_497248 [Jaapia argillacea MUCL 33604]|uniref:UBC core domain-containing protein n=1 Tax=Jaapia argillacea MUCL 33604 TaxID=933084 RepID=A0A067PL21_9AGAM|nr:hypothetical protein JAAARDRAFT_497248 [Jaapia argillacea MUCL 33604]
MLNVSGSASSGGMDAKWAALKDKNSKLKGRRRFVADVRDMKEACKEGYEGYGMRIERFREGDEEGNIEFKLVKGDQPIVAINLLVSDTSEYPAHHTFFAFSPDSDLPPRVESVIENLSSAKSSSIPETINKILLDLSKSSESKGKHVAMNESQDTDEEEGDDTDYEAYEDLDYQFGMVADNVTSAVSPQRLQHDFLEVVAADFRPGLIRFGTDDFVLTVSQPVINLSIPPHVLMAWDRRLLTTSHHLTLLISGMRGTYPPIKPDGTLNVGQVGQSLNLEFKVGLTRRYKPGREQTGEIIRNFGLVERDDEIGATLDGGGAAGAGESEWGLGEDEDGPMMEEDIPKPLVETEEDDPGRFQSFSLSSSLESLLNQAFVKVLGYRIKFGLGWAGAEALLAEVERMQSKPEDVFARLKNVMMEEDREERTVAQTYHLPHDPLLNREPNAELNLPLIAYSYLVRRMTLCTRYCPVCHNKLKMQYEALKPYVCDSKLCAYQYYSYNRGPSLEYEIQTNPESVDLLVSLTYIAAAEGSLEDPLPTGLGLRVPMPNGSIQSRVPNPTGFGMVGPVTTAMVPPGFPGYNNVVVPADASVSADPVADPRDGLVDLDSLALPEMRAAIVKLIDSIPSIAKIKAHLDRKVKAGKSRPKLRDVDPSVLPAAWSILRWCIASSTAYLEEITEQEDLIRNVEAPWRQFRFSVGAPDTEGKFKTALQAAQQSNANAATYPSLYAFHGSPARNWHSIIRHGLWFKTIAHGRAYGNGVYFAKEGSISMGSYAVKSQTCWRNSNIRPNSCAALAEIVNLPQQFVSNNPYFVIAQTDWIVCRYLLVNGAPKEEDLENTTFGAEEEAKKKQKKDDKVPFVTLDPAQPITLANHKVQIPEPSHKIDKLMRARREEYCEEDYDEDDADIFAAKEVLSRKPMEVIVIEDTPPPPDVGLSQRGGVDDWEHSPDWVQECMQHVMPPPAEASPMATMALQRELKAILKEQERARSLKELGWYMPPELIGDNLFQWIVELHSFEKSLPIAKDLVARGVNSLVFEIRFPPAFPHAPPFFRIIKPRFLPFIHGGGGHVTGGGSICMDLLTSDGWLPSYNIPSILLQIRLAISNLDPRPARLATNWDQPYGVHEALEGFRRAATTHGWKVPEGLERLLR